MQQRNRTLDVLKGLGTMMVITTHFDWALSETLHLLFPYWIDMAIPVFMMISGYVSAVSMQNSNTNTLEEMYAPKKILGKILRFFVPYTIAYSAERIYGLLKISRDVSVLEIIKVYLNGGIGPGSYYFPIMLQFIFVFPIIYTLIKKYDIKGLAICGGANVCYEILKWAYGMNEGFYRLMLFRYTLLIAFGCFLAVSRTEIKKPWHFAAFAAGFAFITVYRYFGYTPVILTYWTYTCFLSSLFIMPIFYYIVKHVNLHFRPLEVMGAASFNIYLTQMVYYEFGLIFVYNRVHNRALQLVANLIICIIVGVIFYKIEDPLTKKLKRKLLK